MREKIAIVLLAEIEEKILEKLKSHLNRIFSLEIKISQLKLNLDFAFNEKRGQYFADLILERLTDFKKKDLEKWLAICDVDLFAEGLNFVFGEADVRKGIAIISLSRLRQSFYGLPEDESLFLERIKKEATHELGHLFYLTHCSNPNCVMYFSNSLADTNRKSSYFCQKCKDRLKRLFNLK
jgi:archaemetzincin